MHLGPTKASLLYYLSPVLGVIMAQVFLDEDLTINQITGLVLVLIGISLPLIKRSDVIEV
jgi:drug/metabolite transporter (DMT)-like permease